MDEENSWGGKLTILTSPKQYKTFCFAFPKPSPVGAQKQLPWQIVNMVGQCSLIEYHLTCEHGKIMFTQLFLCTKSIKSCSNYLLRKCQLVVLSLPHNLHSCCHSHN